MLETFLKFAVFPLLFFFHYIRLWLNKLQQVREKAKQYDWQPMRGRKEMTLQKQAEILFEGKLTGVPKN